MNKANELAKRWVKSPQKDGADWVVSWLCGAALKRESFVTADDAYAFYYTKIGKLAEKLGKNR